MKPTIEQLQLRLQDAKAHLSALCHREECAKVRLVEVRDRVEALQMQIKTITEQQDYAHQQPV
jgi:hypothetical protein